MYNGKYLGASAAEKTEKPEAKKNRWSNTRIFYTIYAGCAALIMVCILLLLIPLNNWLKTYQLSQPENKSEEIFDQYFAQPDWAALYALADIEDTPFEGKETYISYITEKVGTNTLTFLETSAGLSGNRKYLIRSGNENIASFTLAGTEDEKTKITNWHLDKVELFFARKYNVIVEKAVDQTVYINSVALDDSYTLINTATLAEDYLPDGIHGYRRTLQALDGLLAAPVVTVKNADGTECPVTVNENGVYIAQIPPMEISEAEQSIAIGAAKANALYAIRAIGQSELRKHFDSTSQIYQDICNTSVFMQDYRDYYFDDSATVISDFYRYSENLFSAHVALALKVTRMDGTVKTYDAATTYFFTRQENGEFRVTDITNIHIQQLRKQVKLTFVVDDQTQSMMAEADAKNLTLPAVTPPAGHTLRGWAKQEKDENGRTVMTIVFTPNENGEVQLSGAQPLEPMTLYPIFEKQ